MSTDKLNEPHRALSTSARLTLTSLSLAASVALCLAWLNQSRDSIDESSAKSPPALKRNIPTKPMWSPDGVEAFSLTERSGQTVTNKDLLGRPWVVSFVFTRCAGPCPLITGQFRAMQDALFPEDGTDPGFRLVTVSVDPKHDTAEVLGKYADLFKADPKYWLFLTGDQQKIYHMIQHSFQMPVEEKLGKEREPGFEVLHTGNVLLVDAAGRVQEKFAVIHFNAVSDAEVVRLRRTLKKIQSEAKSAASSGE